MARAKGVDIRLGWLSKPVQGGGNRLQGQLTDQVVDRLFREILNSADLEGKAHLQAGRQQGSAAFLSAMPSSEMQRFDDET